MKVFNSPEFHFSGVTSFKIGTYFNLIFQTRFFPSLKQTQYFKLENDKNQVQIDRGKDLQSMAENYTQTQNFKFSRSIFVCKTQPKDFKFLNWLSEVYSKLFEVNLNPLKCSILSFQGCHFSL